MRRGDDDDDIAGDYGSQGRQERSKSARRADQMNLLTWEEEDTIKERRIKESEDYQYHTDHRSASNERKRVRASEGKDMHKLIAFQKQESPFREK